MYSMLFAPARNFIKRTARRGVLVAAVAFVLATPAAANATPITLTATGTGSNGALSATADFIMSPGSLTVTITNTLAASMINSAGQAVSDLVFTLSDAPGTLGITSASGQLVSIDSSDNVTDVSGNPVRWLGEGPKPPGGTGFFSIVGDTITLEALGGGKPSEMILPAASTYSDANSSITQNFSPFIDGSATFTLALSGVTVDTTVTGATFSFGTGPDTIIKVGPDPPPPPVNVPEPSTIALLGGLLFALAGVRGLGRVYAHLAE